MKLNTFIFGGFLLPLFLLVSCSKKTNNQTDYCEKTTITDSLDLPENIPGETMGEKLESLLFWEQDEKERRFPMMHSIFPSSKINTGERVYDLAEGEEIQLKWEDETTIDSYIKDNHIGGIVVLQNDKIRLEKYGKNYDKHTTWTSYSVAKSVTSMLLGVALKEGDIKSLDDKLETYIPELKGEDYGKVTVEQLLTMTSGIEWNEDYEDHNSDVAQMYLQPCENEEPHILTYMKSLESVHQPGSQWNYSTGETDLLGILIQKATNQKLSTYLSEKLWQPWGMEQCAYWLEDECSGMNISGSGISANLRDYARIGTVMLKEGVIDGKKLIADEWMKDATTLLQKTGEGEEGYGYLWWRFEDGSYAAMGIFGQMIYVNPAKDLVIAQYAAWPKASSEELNKKRQAFIQAVERSL